MACLRRSNHMFESMEVSSDLSGSFEILHSNKFLVVIPMLCVDRWNYLRQHTVTLGVNVSSRPEKTRIEEILMVPCSTGVQENDLSEKRESIASNKKNCLNALANRGFGRQRESKTGDLFALNCFRVPGRPRELDKLVKELVSPTYLRQIFAPSHWVQFLHG